MTDAARQRKLESIRRQGLTGALIALIGIGIAAAIFASVGEKAAEANPMVLMPGIVVTGIGTLMLVIARYRKMFLSARSFVTHFGKGAIGAILEELD